MASPPILDLDALLEPIAPDAPTGRDLAYESEFDELQEARRAEDDTHQGDWQRKAKVSEWDRVVALSVAYLTGKTKDLRIAAWLTEALVRLHGFAGLRDGFRLLTGLQDRFWEGLFPEIEDGDLDARATPFEFLNRDTLLPFLIRSIPVTSGFGAEDYSYLRYKESRDTDNAVRKDPDQLSVLLGEGKINSEIFDKAVAQSSLAFYEGLVEDLKDCAAAFSELDGANDRHFGRDAPSLTGVRKALEDCRKLLEPILDAKRTQQGDAGQRTEESAPDPEEAPAEAETWAASAEHAEDEPQAEATEADEPGDEDKPVTPVRRRAARSSAGPIADAEDARQRIVEAAAYLRQDEPGRPAAHLVVRALRLAEVYGLPRPLEASELASPSSEVRLTLRRLAAEQQWAELLEEAEAALGRPEGRAWLDAQRLAIVALEATGAAAAAAAARALLRAVLADFPDLPAVELADGTPAANAETRTWLEAEFGPMTRTASARPVTIFDESPAPAEEYGQEPGPEEPEATAPAAPPDPWENAREAVRDGRVAEGVLILQHALARAGTGREKFHRTLQLTELLLMARQDRLALPLAEDLTRQIDRFSLEQWESPELIARAWGTLYHCLRASGDGAADRLPPVFAHLCRLDISRALRFDGDGAG